MGWAAGHPAVRGESSLAGRRGCRRYGRAIGRLVYVTNLSLDGFIEDADGAFDWAPPDEEVFAAATAVVKSAGTLLYGRRLYETMAVWETDPALAGQSDLAAEFAAAWRAADKVVVSRTLSAAPTRSTRIVRHFDRTAVARLKSGADRDVLIGGAELTGQAFAAGLVDELELFVWPIILGGGKPGLPAGVRTWLALVDEHRFANGVMRLRYRLAR